MGSSNITSAHRTTGIIIITATRLIVSDDQYVPYVLKETMLFADAIWVKRFDPAWQGIYLHLFSASSTILSDTPQIIPHHGSPRCAQTSFDTSYENIGPEEHADPDLSLELQSVSRLLSATWMPASLTKEGHALYATSLHSDTTKRLRDLVTGDMIFPVLVYERCYT